MTDFPKLRQLKSARAIFKCDAQTIKEVQLLLARKGFYKGKIDGIAGALTSNAFDQFKESVWLGWSEILGPSTALALLEIANNHQVSEQLDGASDASAALSIHRSKTGRSGRSLKLVSGATIYEHDYIVPGIPLTWGEMTARCSRAPESKQVIANIIKTTIGFGSIREQYGSAININSGYRPRHVNENIGGARYSQHIHGLAIDICPADGNLQRLFEICRHSNCTGLGRGMHRGFVHADWRCGPRVVFDY